MRSSLLRPLRSGSLAPAALAAAALLFTGLVVHRLHFAWTHTANVLFWDQWDIYWPLFRGEGAWELFNFQQGPHRQGLGSLLTAALAQFTAWDVRYDSLLAVVATAAACGAAVRVARLCGANLVLSLAAIPVFGLSLQQYELWTGPANPSHSALPLLLIMLYAWSWFIDTTATRIAVQIALTALLVFTGFGLFAGAVASALFFIDAVLLWRSDRSAEALASLGGAAASGAVWMMFFHGYVFDPSVPGFTFPHDRPFEYAGFSALLFANYGGWKGKLVYALTLGGILMLLTLGVAFAHGRKLWRGPLAERPVCVVLFVLTAATLLFCLNTAIGRVSLGWRTGGYSSRYVALLVPAMVALFIASQRSPRPWLRGISAAALVLIGGWNGLTPTDEVERVAKGFRESRITWRDVYLATGDKTVADTASQAVNGFAIHPGDLGGRLEFLRRQRLNFFRDRVQPD